MPTEARDHAPADDPLLVRPFSAPWLLVVLALLGGCVAAALEARERLDELYATPLVIAVPGPSAPAPPPRCPETPSGVDSAARILAEAELGSARERLRDLENRNRHLRHLLEQQTAAMQRAQRANLRRSGASPSSRGSQRRSRSPTPKSRIRAAAPRVSLFGDRALIAGTVANGGDRDEEPRLTVQLLQRGRVVEEQDLFVAVPAGSSASYSLFVPISQRSGAYSAKVYVSG